MPHLGMFLRKTREELRVSMRELARRSGLDVTQIARIEHGVYANPSVLTLMRLSDGLHVSVAELAEISAKEFRAPQADRSSAPR